MHEELVARQAAAFSSDVWGPDSAAPYPERRDGTLADYLSNYYPIRLEPFFRTLVGKTAVTVCDGRGTETGYLEAMGLETTATDISTARLAELKDQGLVSKWKTENAEALSFKSDSFDWGMVRAGLHHLPRPLLGLYELLRVAREGVVVIEAQDGVLLRTLRRMLSPKRDWEPSGNYVYRFSKREITKVCLGLELPGVAISTSFVVWRRKYKNLRKGSFTYKLRKFSLRLINCVASRHGNAMAAVLFKTPPTAEQLRSLKKAGFVWHALPRNPFR